jgi:hypothetical protein
MSYLMEKAGKDPASGGPGSSKASRPLDLKKEDWVGRQLRRVYDEAASEPLPAELLSLLAQIEDDKDASPKS